MAIYCEDHPLKHFEKGDLEKVLFVTDEMVGNIYLRPLQDFFQFKGLTVFPMTIFSNEAGKSLLQAEALYQILRKENFTKNDGIVAIGGGIVQEIAGFVATSYLGGVPFYQIPTSFYSQLKSPFQKKVALHLENFPNTVALEIVKKDSFVDPFFQETHFEMEQRNAIAFLILLFGSFSEKLFQKLKKFKDLDDFWEHRNKLFEKAYALMEDLTVDQLTFLEEMEALPYVFFGLHPENLSYGEAISLTLQKILAETEKRGFTEKGTNDHLKKLFQKFDLPLEITEVPLLEEQEVHFPKDQLPYWEKVGKYQLLTENKDRLANWFL